MQKKNYIEKQPSTFICAAMQQLHFADYQFSLIKDTINTKKWNKNIFLLEREGEEWELTGAVHSNRMCGICHQNVSLSVNDVNIFQAIACNPSLRNQDQGSQRKNFQWFMNINCIYPFDHRDPRLVQQYNKIKSYTKSISAASARSPSSATAAFRCWTSPNRATICLCLVSRCAANLCSLPPRPRTISRPGGPANSILYAAMLLISVCTNDLASTSAGSIYLVLSLSGWARARANMSSELLAPGPNKTIHKWTIWVLYQMRMSTNGSSQCVHSETYLSVYQTRWASERASERVDPTIASIYKTHQHTLESRKSFWNITVPMK